MIYQVTRPDEVEPALRAGADALIAQGNEAGGHSGLLPLPELLPAIVATAGKVPVLAAGGIVDGRGLAAALALGAAGAWLGTRFLATPEAPISSAWKSAILAAGPGDTIQTLAFDVVWGRIWEGARLRVIRNDFTAAWHGREAILARQIPDVQAQVWQAERTDDPRFFALMAGSGAGEIRELPGWRARQSNRRRGERSDRVVAAIRYLDWHSFMPGVTWLPYGCRNYGPPSFATTGK